MTHLFSDLLRLLLRLVLLVAGAVFFVSVLAAAAVLAVVWLGRIGWARLTGRPAGPVPLGADPLASWRRYRAASARWTGPMEASPRRPVQDVEDAVVKTVPTPGGSSES